MNIILKKDQSSGKLTRGIVRDILTKSSFHTHGIKVRLVSGEVGRVQEVFDVSGYESLIRPGSFSVMTIISLEDVAMSYGPRQLFEGVSFGLEDSASTGNVRRVEPRDKQMRANRL